MIIREGEGDNMKSCPICKSNNVKLSGEGYIGIKY